MLIANASFNLLGNGNNRGNGRLKKVDQVEADPLGSGYLVVADAKESGWKRLYPRQQR
jgi:hypothetical protein